MMLEALKTSTCSVILLGLWKITYPQYEYLLGELAVNYQFHFGSQAVNN
jgi:hypothetical protein